MNACATHIRLSAGRSSYHRRWSFTWRGTLHLFARYLITGHKILQLMEFLLRVGCAFQPPPVRGDELKDGGKSFSYDYSYDSADKGSPTFASQERVFVFWKSCFFLSFICCVFFFFTWYFNKPFLCCFRFFKTWGLMSWKLRLRVSMPVCLPMAKPAQGNLTPWWVIQ